MRALRIIGVVVGVLVVLIIVALLAIKAFVDPNQYKDRIAQAVKTRTGRDLALPGAIKLAVCPWIALEFGPASLGNPPGFPAQPFAQVQHVAVRVRVLPLLRKQLEIGRVEVDGLDLRLLKNQAGQGNWQFGSSAPSTPSDTSKPMQLPDLAGLTLRDSRVQYQGITAEHVELDVGHVLAGQPVPVDFRLELRTSQKAQPIPASGKLTLTADPAREQYGVSKLDLSGTYLPNGAVAAVPWSLAVPAGSADLAAGTLSLPSFDAALAGARLSGDARASELASSPRLQLAFRLAPLDARVLLPRLGLAAPVTRDRQALARVAATGQLAYGGNAARVNSLDLQLDDTHLRGEAGLTDLTHGAIAFDLAIDHIDLDRYRAPASTARPAPQQAPPSSRSAQPLDALRTLQMKGALAIGALTVAGLKVSEVRVGVQADGGVTHIAPATARLYGGSYSGTITLDDRSGTPAMQLDQTMNGIDVAQLLADFAHTRRLSGRGMVTTHLTARGSEADALMR